MKFCKNCQREKDLTEFNKNSGRKDGYDFYCRTCTKAKAKEYVIKNKDLKNRL